MAKKGKLDKILFCDRCGGSIPDGTKPFTVSRPDGTVESLCQECMWAAKSEEEQPTVAVDDDLAVSEAALQAIHRPEEVLPEVPLALVQEQPEEEVVATPVSGGLALRRCKTFVAQATGQALDFLDRHIAEYIQTRKIHVKQVSTCYGMAGIGTQGTRVDAIFVTIWW